MSTEDRWKTFGKTVLPSLLTSSSSRSAAAHKWRHFATDVQLSVGVFSVSSPLICPRPEIFLSSVLQVCLYEPSALSRGYVCLLTSLSHFQHLQIRYKSWSERENQQDATVRCLLSILSQHVSGIIMPIFRKTRRVLLHVVCCAVTSGENMFRKCW